MKHIVKLLIVCLITLSITSCSGVDTVFNECHTPGVKKPIYDNKHCKNILDKAKQCLRNHAIKDKYIRELEAANEVCR